MCKIFTLTNTSKIKALDKATNTIAKHLAAREGDGFGYSVLGKKGIFGERTLFPDSFRASFSRPMLSVPWVTHSYNRFGTKTEGIGPGIFHGRTSTNEKTLVNTHPINKHDWSLIHNGVVSNHGPVYETITTNDTEHLVHYLANHGIRSIEEHLTGYYAVSAISPDGRLHIIKDSTANLFSARIETIDSLVFATTQCLIEDICKELKWKHSVISPVTNNTYLILSGNTLDHHETINPRGRTITESRFASQSLGYSLDDDSYTRSVSSLNLYSPAPVTSDLTEDEQCFLREIEQCADGSYTFKDYRGNDMSLEDFRLLCDDEKLACTVIRDDGTIVSPTDYYTEKLYIGA